MPHTGWFFFKLFRKTFFDAEIEAHVYFSLSLCNSDDPAARNSAKSFEAEHHLIFLVWFQDQRKREAHLEKERERKRAAYAKKKLALEELKQRHKAS